MTIINNKEFATNQKKYFDMAINEEVFIKKNKNMFHLATITDNIQAKERVYYEPDEDFDNSITSEELKEKALEIVEKIHNRYSKNERNIYIENT
jgi:predicted transcriptional regulator